MLDVNSLLGFQPKTPQVGQVVVTGGVGYGSVGTAIRTFTTVVESLGSSIVYRKDLIQGDFFEITQSGIYYAQYWDQKNATLSLGITANQENLTTGIASLVEPVVLSYINGTTGFTVQTSCVAYLKAGTKVRANSSNAATSTAAADVGFRICLIRAT